jgi:hypothetical protein
MIELFTMFSPLVLLTESAAFAVWIWWAFWIPSR